MKPVTSGHFTWSEKDEDYYLQRSKFIKIPLTPLQRTKINSALGNNENPTIYLSPKQKKWLTSLNNNIRYNKNFKKNWAKLLANSK